jgi:hypothetical protein
MAKAKGIKNYVNVAKRRKSGLVDVLGKDNGTSFAVGKKGDARVGKKPGKRLALLRDPRSPTAPSSRGRFLAT